MTARMSALWLRKHLGGLRVRLHETNEPHFQPSAPCGVDATLTLLAMRLEMERGQLRSAATIAEKAAPYVHPKMAPRANDDGDGDTEVTIKIVGGLPE